MSKTLNKSNIEAGPNNQKCTLNPVEFINYKFKKSTLLELQDALTAFSENSAETKAKIEKIIPKNFAKFITCKGLMDRIKNDYSDRSLAKINSDREIDFLLKSFNELITKYKIQSDDSKDKTSNLVFPVKELKEILRSNLLNFDFFVTTLKNEIKSVEIYGKELQDEILEEIKPEIKDFIQILYDQILNSNVNFEETYKLVGIYLYLCTFESGYNTELKKQKLINTMLVNYKEDTFNNMEATEEYYSNSFSSLLKFLEHSDENQGIAAINHLFSCLFSIIKTLEPKYSKIVFRKIDSIIKSYKGKQYYLNEMKSECSHLRIDAFQYFISKSDISKIFIVFDCFIGILKDQEIRKAKDCIANKVIDHLLLSSKSEFEYIEEQDRCVKMVNRCFGYAESKTVKELERKLRDKITKEILKIAKKFSELFNEEHSDVEILMEATRIIERSTVNNFKIFFECKKQIQERPIIMYYLHSYMKMDVEELNAEEQQIAENLKTQFEHLLE